MDTRPLDVLPQEGVEDNQEVLPPPQRVKPPGELVAGQFPHRRHRPFGIAGENLVQPGVFRRYRRSIIEAAIDCSYRSCRLSSGLTDGRGGGKAGRLLPSPQRQRLPLPQRRRNPLECPDQRPFIPPPPAGCSGTQKGNRDPLAVRFRTPQFPPRGLQRRAGVGGVEIGAEAEKPLFRL